MFLACVQQREWETFCAAIEKPALAGQWPPEDSAADEIAAMLATRPADEWERALAEHDVPLVSVETRDPGRFALESRMMRDQGHMVDVKAPVYGKYKRHGALQKFSGEKLTFGGWEPLGGHTRSILTELGYADDETDELIESEVAEEWVPS